jgi:transcriptional regulator with XRE-family HTH domain
MAKSETIGERIYRLRTEQGLSQRDLSQRDLSQRDLSQPGVSYAYLSRIEANDRHASLSALRKIAAKLGTSALYLETGRGDVRCPHCGRKA